MGFFNTLDIALRTSVEDADSSMKIEIRRMRSAQCNKYLDKAGSGFFEKKEGQLGFIMHINGCEICH
jgi:hypothetical protein